MKIVVAVIVIANVKPDACKCEKCDTTVCLCVGLEDDSQKCQEAMDWREKYIDHYYEGDYDFSLKQDKFGNAYYYGHLQNISAATLSYYLKIEYTDYIGNKGEKVFNVCTGYQIDGMTYYYNFDLPGITDITEDEEYFYKRISERDYTFGYAIDSTIFESYVSEDGIRYSSNIMEYLLGEPELRKNVEIYYVTEGYSWEW